MTPTTATTKQQVAQSLSASKSSLPPPAPPCRSSSSQVDVDDNDDDDVVRQLVMGRWRSSLSSGLRAALACTIVGLVSLYAPAALRRHITFPAFAYVVTVILVTDNATVGTALRGAVSALHGTLMGAAPSVAALWLAHATGTAESVVATSAMVALTAFAVALPTQSVGPVAKRIALGQAIIIYVARFRRGERPSRALALMHPANVVACTALGVAAALLAVLLPWPKLAAREASDKSRAYRVVAAERVRVLADAFAAAAGVDAEAEVCSRQRRWQMAACMSEASRLASASTTLLNRMNAIKEDLQWERAVVVVDDNKSSTEMPLTGMQIALATMQQEEADDGGHGRKNKDNNKENMVVGLVMAMRDQIRLALLTPNNNKQRQSRALLFGSSCSTTTPSKSLCHLPTPTNYDYEGQQQQQQQLASCLFLFSLYQLYRRCCGGDGPKTALTTKAAAANARQVAPAATTTTCQELLSERPDDLSPDDEQEEEELEQLGQDDPSSQAEAATEGEDKKATTTTTKHHQQTPGASAGCPSWRWPRRRRLMAATKCGFSLGLAVLLGLLFSNDHGFWSGLIVATTMTAGRESTWSVAMARAHGTALGSIYGVLGCLFMSRQQRLLTMDLRFVALLPWMVLAAFLKRSRAYGPAGGVAAALSVVIIMGRRYDEAPMAFAAARLVESFIGISCTVLADLAFQPGARPSVQARAQLARCVAALADCCCCLVAEPSSSEMLTRVQQELALLRKYAAEAGSEPTYLWLPPFPAACYDKIQGSLGRMAQLLQLYHQARRHQQQQMDVDDDTNTTWQRQRRRFSSLASTSLSHCLHMLAPPQKPKGQVVDLEAGTAAGGGTGCSCCYKDGGVVGSFLAQAGEAKLLLLNDDDDDDSVRQPEERLLLVCCLGSMALCMGEILKEAQRLEAHILELNNLQLSTH